MKNIKFLCEHCKTEVIVFHLNPGEEAQCKNCNLKNIVPGETTNSTENLSNSFEYLSANDVSVQDANEEFFTTNNKNIINAISLLQIVGGAVGYYFLYSMFSFSMIFFLILFGLFFGLSVYSGAELLKLSKKGVKLTRINLLLQVIVVYGPFVSYEYFSGCKLAIGWINGQVLTVYFGTNIFMSINQIEIPFGFAINIVPLILLYLLNKNISVDNQLDDSKNNDEPPLI